jgi:aminoglycoside phosphotransferase (APT) family kinase protein
MAGYHANWWDSDELSDSGELGFLDEIVADASRIRLDNEARPEVWSKYLELPRAAALPRSITDPERLFAALKRLWAFNEQAAYCTIHDDCHIGNTYVYPDGRIGFLDWAVKRAPWYKDFTYFLVTALDIDRRREWERELLSHYLLCIEKRGISPPSYEEAWLCYRCELVYSLTIWICNGDAQGQFQNESVNTACAVRAGMAVLDHASLELLR